MSGSRALRVLIPAGLVAQFLATTTPNVSDNDIFHQMSLARYLLTEGRFPLADPFAYTDTVYPVVHHEWGTGVVAYVLATNAGGWALVALRLAVALGIGWLCWSCARSRDVGIGVMSYSAPFALFLLCRGFVSLFRAHTFSFLFTSLLLWYMEQDRRGQRRWMLSWGAVWLVWLNLHGGFTVGLAVLGAYWVERVVRRELHWHILVAGAAMVLLVAANPYGVEYYRYILSATTMDRPLIREWAAIWYVGWGPVVLFALSLGVMVYAIHERGVGGLPGLSVLALLALGSICVNRLLPFYAIAWTAYVPAHLAGTRLGQQIEQLYAGQRRLMTALWSCAAVGLLALALWRQPWRVHVPDHRVPGARCRHTVFPVGPVDYLRRVDFRGNAMTRFGWGAYVTWELYPSVKVAMDSRYEAAYPLGSADRNETLYRANPGWHRVLAECDPDVVILTRSGPLADAMPGAARWERVYVDAYWQVYAGPDLQLPRMDRSGMSFVDSLP